MTIDNQLAPKLLKKLGHFTQVSTVFYINQTAQLFTLFAVKIVCGIDTMMTFTKS